MRRLTPWVLVLAVASGACRSKQEEEPSIEWARKPEVPVTIASYDDALAAHRDAGGETPLGEEVCRLHLSLLRARMCHKHINGTAKALVVDGRVVGLTIKATPDDAEVRSCLQKYLVRGIDFGSGTNGTCVRVFTPDAEL